MKPLMKLIRLGDSHLPQMGNVYETCLDVYAEIERGVREKPDVEDGGPFDYDRLVALETICEKRHQYLHCEYHGVGYLLNPKFFDVDLKERHKDQSGVWMELKDNLELVASRLFHTDLDKAADVMTQYTTYSSAGPHRTALLAAQVQKVKAGTLEPWKFWDAIGHKFPELAIVGQKVLSKQVGVGDVERSHKKMKKVVFSNERPRLDPKRANRELYINYNLRQLDNEPEPLWVKQLAFGQSDETDGSSDDEE
jgi:hypothetical protein